MSRKEVDKFIKELKNIIYDTNFDIDQNFYLNMGSKNTQTLLDLEYIKEDVLDILSELTINDYSETLLDKDNQNPPLLIVFGKIINQKEVYIKIKHRSAPKKEIICVSFHWSEHIMVYPYK